MALTLAAPNDKDALVMGDRHLSYVELLERAWELSGEAATHEASQVVIFAENSLDWAVAAYAIWAAKKVLVPIDAQSTAEDVAYVLEDCQATLVFASRQTRDVLDRALASLGDNSVQVVTLEGLIERPVTERSAPPIVADDESELATIIYTSGTTGTPKGVMLTYANLHANLRVVRDVGYFAPDERVLLLLPLHHVLPLMGCLLAPLATGGTSVLCPSLAKDDIIEVLQRHKITMLVGVPRFYELLGRGISQKIESSFVAKRLFSWAQRAQSEPLSRKLFKKVHDGFGGHLRYMICGGAPLDPTVAELFGTLGFRLCEGYGMTECAPLISFPDPAKIKPGYCGKPVLGAEVELRDGEIVVRGPQVMRGYFNRPEETAEVLKDGWLYTGDLGAFDEARNLRITGRKKEILVLPNGKNVNPQLSEVMLEEHAAVAEAAVYLDGEVLHALVVVEPDSIPSGETDRESYLWSTVATDYNRRVAPYRQISRLSVIDEPLPRTRLGKLRRHLLADLGSAAREERAALPAEDETDQQLIAYLLRSGCPQVSPQSRLGADLGVDSMARLELREFIRKSWGTSIEETELNDRLRVGELGQLIRARAEGDYSDADIDWKEILTEGPPAELPRTSLLHLLILLGLRVLVFVGVRLRSHGVDTVPNGPKIFAPNHQSAIDGVFLTACLSLPAARGVFFLAKERHMRHPLVRFLADRGRIIVMEQSAGLQASLKATASALRADCSVVVFPEGTRSKDGTLGDFKSSYAIVAKHTGAPIVPVALEGARGVLPKGALLPRFGRKVHVHFLQAVVADGDADEANGSVREAISNRLHG